MTSRSNARVRELQSRLIEVRGELRTALADAARLEAENHVFVTPRGPVTLRELFGNRQDLFVVHNMGTGCSSCTMWADGFNGLYPHITNRAAFVVSSPDAPDVQSEIATGRGWKFRMVSDGDRSFAAAMGFTDERGRALPGVSAFQLREGRILRTSAAPFNEMDEYCPTWRLFDLLPESAGDWRPKAAYD